MRTLRHRQRLAGWLFVPYLIWILFASYLNLYVLAANGTGF
nr:tryptophan-rich sensory protein [Alistipes megaguti]